MSKVQLERISLSESDSLCTRVDEIPASAGVNVEISFLTLAARGPEHVECRVEFRFELSSSYGDATFCEITAEYRLIYRAPYPKSEDRQREFAATVAAPDAWRSWRDHLSYTLTQMGLTPVYLTPYAPDELVPNARTTFDDTVKFRREHPQFADE